MLDKEHTLAVHVRRVSKNFFQGDAYVKALKEIDFDARIGELMMIVGPSGCGKTTLLSVVAGVLNFDAGEIDIFGNSIHNLSKKEITEFRKVNIGFVFQQYHLIPTLNLVENVTIPLLLANVDPKIATEKAIKLLKIVGLEGKEYRLPKEISGGEQQRVAIARALIHEPSLLICDEPTAALDAENGLRIMELLVSIAKTPGRCVIVVTHDSRIYKFADRIAKMDDGNVFAIDSSHLEN